MNLSNESDWAHSSDCPGCQECEPATTDDHCEMHPEDGAHERLSFADECAYCAVRLAP